MTWTIKPDISLETRRCYNCRRWWAYETDLGAGGRTCPYCADATLTEYRKRADTAERSARGLRGALKRVKRG